MSVCSVAKSVYPAALEATVTTLTVPGLRKPRGIFVLADGTRLFSSAHQTILQVAPSDRQVTLAGNKDEVGELKDGEGISTRFKCPTGLTVDRAGNVIVVDYGINTICKVTKAGAVVSTLAGNGKADFADEQGADTRFNMPHSVVVAANGDLIVSDCDNHFLRVVPSVRWWATGSPVLLTGRGRTRT